MSILDKLLGAGNPTSPTRSEATAPSSLQSPASIPASVTATNPQANPLAKFAIPTLTQPKPVAPAPAVQDPLSKFMDTTGLIAKPSAPQVGSNYLAKLQTRMAEVAAPIKAEPSKLLDQFKVPAPFERKLAAEAKVEEATGLLVKDLPSPSLLSQIPALSSLGDFLRKAEKGQESSTAVSLESASQAPTVEAPASQDSTNSSGRVEKNQLTYDLANEDQRRAVDWAAEGKSFNLIGSAGSGKTATQGLLTSELLIRNIIKTNFELKDHKYLPKECLNILICSYMNRATNNIRNAVQPEFKLNVITIHKALEYQPVEEDVEKIDENGNIYSVTRKVFRPMRGPDNLLVGIDIVVMEEAGTCSGELEGQLRAALPNNGADCQWIYLGDLKQLPPVFGQSVLADRLLELPTVELTTIYRTALDSPIKRFAIAINEGKPFTDAQLKSEFSTPGELEFFNLSGKREDGSKIGRKSSQLISPGLGVHFSKLLAAGVFVPFRDVILCPFRVNVADKKTHNGINCEYLNSLIADSAGKSRDAEVHEIQAGRVKKYFAVGDPVYHEKYEYEIIAITKNKGYRGAPTKIPSIHMDRFGNFHDPDMADLSFDVQVAETLTMQIVSGPGMEMEDEDTTKLASHSLTLQLWTADPNEPTRTIEVSAAGQIAAIDFAYCLTVHKSIGSEWEKVWCLFHHSMVGMMFRELLYTAVTRAKSYLGIFYDGQDLDNLRKLHSSMISTAILNPQIKGITLQEKLEWLRLQKARGAEAGKDLLSQFNGAAVSLKLPN